MTGLALVIPAFLSLMAYVVLRLRRGHIELVARRVFNDLIVPNLDGARFDPAEAARLPIAAARYLNHAIAPGTPLARTVDLSFAGRFRAAPGDDWLRFESRQRLVAGRGFICRSRLEGPGRQAQTVIEYLSSGTARCRRFLADLLPLSDRRGSGALRAAAGRMLLESVWLPAALLPSRGAVWKGDNEGSATVRIDGESAVLNLTIDERGGLRRAAMLRYRDGPPGAAGLAPFGLRVEGETTVDGFTVPARVIATWGYGTDEAFDGLILELCDARYY